MSPPADTAINITCAPCPAPELIDINPVIYFNGLPQVINYGQITQIKMNPGNYSITAHPLKSEHQLVSCDVLPVPSNVEVQNEQTSKLSISFGEVTRCTAIKITVANLINLSYATLKIHAYLDESLIESIDASINSTYFIKNLPTSGSVKLVIPEISLNNKKFFFPDKIVILSNNLLSVLINDTSVITTPIDTQGFLNLLVDFDDFSLVNHPLTIYLFSKDHDMNYAEKVILVSDQKVPFLTPVKAGAYSIAFDYTDVIVDSILYHFYYGPTDNDVYTPVNHTILGVLDEITTMKVRGFPDFIAFGGYSDPQTSNLQDFIDARASAIFQYSGKDGAGDANVFLTDDPAVSRIIDMARDTEDAIGNDHITVPVMVSYTCNLSVGDTRTILQNAERHKHSYANYVLSLTIAAKRADSNHPIGACFVLNPDFLATCQQENLSPKHSMPVRQPLTDAILHCVSQGLISSLTIPDDIEENLRGYVRSVNWLTHAVAGNKVSFGWQSNPWANGDTDWVYSEPYVETLGYSVARYAINCGINPNDNYPVNFHVLDRYERDDFSQDAYVKSSCYGPKEWARYFEFCYWFTDLMELPTMLWQIPASHIPLTTDNVNEDFEINQHWGTGGSCIFGHPELKSDVRNIHNTVSSFEFSADHPIGDYKNIGELFALPFDLRQPIYTDLLRIGIFSVLLGSTKSTGITKIIGDPSPWVRDKLHEYAKNPARLSLGPHENPNKVFFRKPYKTSRVLSRNRPKRKS